MTGIIETDRLYLRPWRESDAGALFRYAKDPAVGSPAGWPPHASVEESLEVIRTVFSAPEVYAVVLKETGEPVGSCGIIFHGDTHSDAIEENEGEIGYWIGVPHWGNGYIPEAVDALIARAFDELGLSALWIGYFDGNDKSRRVAEKCGFKYHHSEKGEESRPEEHFMRLECNDMMNRSGAGRKPAKAAKCLSLRLVTEDKERFMSLLLVGDEQESMVRSYLHSCSLYVASACGTQIGVCAVCTLPDGCIEIKNIAVADGFRRNGYGKAIIGMVAELYGDCTLRAGTGDVPSTVGFYESCGFVRAGRVPDFFTLNYDHPIIEDGILLKDMVYFEKACGNRKHRNALRIFEMDGLQELKEYLSGQPDAEKLREDLFAEFLRYASYRDADGWNRAVRLCECLAITGWGGHEPLEAVKGVWFNGNPDTFFVNRYGKVRFLDAVWSKRKDGLAIDCGQSSFHASPDAPGLVCSLLNDRDAVGPVCGSGLLGQRNWIPKNPICLMRGLANCYENSRAVIESMETELKPELDRQMRPELYGGAVNRIVLNCSFSFYDNYHCKTNYVIADETLKLKQKDFYPELLKMFTEQEIEDNGYYLRNRFTYGPFRQDIGIARVGIVFEKEFSDMPHGRQKQVMGGYFLHAVQQVAKRLDKKVDYDICLMIDDFSRILEDWCGGESLC